MPSEEIEAQRRRLLILLASLLAVTIVIVGRLLYWQVAKADEIKETRQCTKIIAPTRGEMRDTHGDLLAGGVTTYNVIATPREMTAITTTAETLAPILGRTKEALLASMRESPDYVRLARRVSADVRQRIQRLKLRAISFEPEYQRVYPGGTAAAHLLGFVQYEGQGVLGVEGAYDGLLRGKDGELKTVCGPDGKEVPVAPRLYTAPQNGATLTLTVDRNIQYMAQTILEQRIAAEKAAGGTIIVLDPRTGAILAMANWPTFDLNNFADADPKVFRNPALVPYEPGSAFKIITMAAGLQSKTITPSTTFYCQGATTVGSTKITNADKKAHGYETMTQVLQHSCNVGMVFVAGKLGRETFYKFVRNFGFGQATGVDLQGEEVGIVKYPNSNAWSPLELATNSFGQGIAVTPLQLAVGVAAVANGGALLQPYAVQKIVDAQGTVTVTRPITVRQVISPETARTLSEMLVEVVEHEGKLVSIPGYRLAGKTGTAEVFVNGRYAPDQFIDTFVGFGPADDARFVILVKIDHPKVNKWALDVAGPAFRSLANWLLAYWRIPPQ
ncbi:MAG: penicillin-binding protein 2 [Chloroflexi bacterium]|nr:penicillin-binding protein 2 [Chloroflexota bacterium]